MGIRKDAKTGTYIITYHKRHPVTKESRSIRRQGIKSEAEANRVYKDLIFKMAEKFNEDINPYWSEVVEKFLIYFANKGVANNTLINYGGSLKTHTYEKWEGLRINQITTGNIRDLILEDLKEFSEAHRKSMLKFIRAVFRYAIEEDIIQRDPTPKLKFKTSEKIKKVLTEEEVRIFLSEARRREHPWFPIWAMACFTGMRNGELYALRWSRVNLERRLMLISESWTKENGYKETKSGDDRHVEIALGLVPILDELLENRTNEFVLPRNQDWENGTQAKVLREFLSELNLPEIRFHDLRASWATIMLSKGIEPIKVMAMGGWKDLKTMQIYVRKSGIHIQGITNLLDLL